MHDDDVCAAFIRALPADRLWTRGRAGNLLILKAAALQSVREILIPPCASRADVSAMAAYADKSDFVLFAGGDQAHYAAWKGSALIDAVRGVYRRGGIVGGGSAGLAIQGQTSRHRMLLVDRSGTATLVQRFDLTRKDGSRKPFYSRNPYSES